MPIDYATLFSARTPADVDSPAGLAAKTKYVFSVTNADPHSLAAEGLSTALQAAIAQEGTDLGPYPPPLGHEGLRQFIVENFRTNRGAEIDVDNVFLSCGAGGAIETVLNAFIDPGDVVMVEEYSYLGTLRMLLERRADVHEDGL